MNLSFLGTFAGDVAVVGLHDRSETNFNTFIYRRPTLYPLEIAVDFLKSL
jgi:hypothetical protein